MPINAIASFRNYSWQRQWNRRINPHPFKAHRIEIFQWGCAFRGYFAIVLERAPYLFLQIFANFWISKKEVRNRRKSCCSGVTSSNPMIPSQSDREHMDIQKLGAHLHKLRSKRSDLDIRNIILILNFKHSCQEIRAIRFCVYPPKNSQNKFPYHTSNALIY